MSRLIYIVGVSGAGKDALINYCRKKINGVVPVIFAHRYITRPANAGSENHIELSVEEFKQRANHNLFAMNWKSHGLHYGIGAEINNWLQQGFVVVVNGSREYLNTALQKYPQMQPILITADAETLKARLTQRGREDEATINSRIARNTVLNFKDEGIILIENNGTVDQAANELLTHILQSQAI